MKQMGNGEVFLTAKELAKVLDVEEVRMGSFGVFLKGRTLKYERWNKEIKA